jgi:copper chaperone CopZ
MSTAVLKVPGISCEHCEQTITNALSGQPGIRSLRVDVPGKQVTLDYDETRLSLNRVREILAEEDYPVESVSQG